MHESNKCTHIEPFFEVSWDFINLILLIYGPQPKLKILIILL